MTTKNTIGLIGLAVMGQNLARNFASRNIKTVVYNRTTTTMETFLSEHGNSFLTGEETLENFVESIAKPRKIFLMVKAGKPVDAVIDQLLPLLDKNDIIIDGGNSHFPDTIRREKELKEKEIRFIGCGVSGGEEGALLGPSIMPGGQKQAVEEVLPYLKKIAAKDFSGNACVTNVGTDGAGHYVKMVHNGIEYAVMQFLAEAYDIMRSSEMNNIQISETFEKWNRGPLASFLVELSAIISKKEDKDGQFLLDKILDSAGQKGTGRWTAIDATSRAVAVPTISAAVDARIFSAQKKLREQLSASMHMDDSRTTPIELENLEGAIYIAMITAYSEGFWLIATAAKEQGWNIDFAELSRIWQGGCIIRAELLKFLENNFRTSSPDTALLTIPEINKKVLRHLPQLSQVTTSSLLRNIAVPGLSAALNHLIQIHRSRGSANFIQGLRDAFGAHTYKRIDAEGSFHSEWESKNE